MSTTLALYHTQRLKHRFYLRPIGGLHRNTPTKTHHYTVARLLDTRWSQFWNNIVCLSCDQYFTLRVTSISWPSASLAITWPTYSKKTPPFCTLDHHLTNIFQKNNSFFHFLLLPWPSPDQHLSFGPLVVPLTITCPTNSKKTCLGHHLTSNQKKETPLGQLVTNNFQKNWRAKAIWRGR